MVHSRKEEKACPSLLMQTSNLQGGEGDSESPDGLRGGKEGGSFSVLSAFPALLPSLSPGSFSHLVSFVFAFSCFVIT